MSTTRYSATRWVEKAWKEIYNRPFCLCCWHHIRFLVASGWAFHFSSAWSSLQHREISASQHLRRNSTQRRLKSVSCFVLMLWNRVWNGFEVKQTTFKSSYEPFNVVSRCSRYGSHTLVCVVMRSKQQVVTSIEWSAEVLSAKMV